MKARATFASVVALLALTAAVVGIAASPAFAATSCGNGQGLPLLLGCDNTATVNTALTVASNSALALYVAETGTSSEGIEATGGNYGVIGFGTPGTGVLGDTLGGVGTGVEGDSDTGTGVEGLTTSGTGVYGHNTGRPASECSG